LQFRWSEQAAAKAKDNEQRSLQEIEPLNLAILIQDDLGFAGRATSLGVTRDFIRSLPQGIARDGWLHHYRYVYRSGSRLRLISKRQQNRYAFRLLQDRVPLSIRTLRYWKRCASLTARWTNANAVLLISDGLDTSRGSIQPRQDTRST
jgi:hypothetical protein